MTQETWSAVDKYIEQHLIAKDPALEETLQNTSDRGYPGHLHIAPNQGKFLTMLMQMNQCKRVLELGTFAAYSTIFMAKALPEDGYILSIEGRDAHLALAKENIVAAGCDHIIDLKLGRAADVLASLPVDTAPFDFIFIDADKENYAIYLELSLLFSHSGTVIVLDNVIRAAEIVNENNQKPSIVGLRQMFEALEKHPKIASSTAMQTVGSKGYDGFAIAIVK